LGEESQIKTAFSAKGEQYCFTRMPFGIAAAPGTFQEMMTRMLTGLDNTLVYLDDIMVYTKSLEDHYSTLDTVLKRITATGLRVNPEKCHLLKMEVKFLGHIVDKEGVRTDPSKIEAMKSFERPKCIKSLRSFLGICNYYRKFIKEYSKKSRLLEELVRRNKQKLIWTEKCNEAFKELKEALTISPILAFPDKNKQFILDTDASFDTIGAVLSQKDDQVKERLIAYGSHAMKKHEFGYCITRIELLAIHYICDHFRHYLIGKRFILRTDQKALTFMLYTEKPITPQFQNLINHLSSLDMEIQYRPGENHGNADMLSRNVCGTRAHCSIEHEEPKTMKSKTRQINAIEEKIDHKWTQKDKDDMNQIARSI